MGRVVVRRELGPPNLGAMSRRSAAALVLLALLVLVTACNDDDGADVRTLGDSSGSGSASATGETPCAPVGEELEAEATETVEVQLVDFAFVPDRVEVAAGVVTFAATNGGGANHELAFLPGGGDVPFTDEGAPDEDALGAAGAFELEGFSPGQTCNATYDLEPGEYTLFCIVEAADGETHYEKGMRGTLTVT